VIFVLLAGIISREERRIVDVVTSFAALHSVRSTQMKTIPIKALCADVISPKDKTSSKIDGISAHKQTFSTSSSKIVTSRPRSPIVYESTF